MQASEGGGAEVVVGEWVKKDTRRKEEWFTSKGVFKDWRKERLR